MIELPIKVHIRANNNQKQYPLRVRSNLQTITLHSNTVINATIIDVPQYEGDYVVDPSAHNAITLETNGKMCTDDIIVNKIRTAETSNVYGTTYFIAEES